MHEPDAPRRNELGQTIGEALPEWSSARRPSGAALDGRTCRVERLDVARHARALFDAFAADADGALWTYLPVGPFANVIEFDRWLEQVVAREDPLYYAICERAAGDAVGLTSYLRIQPEHGSIEVGHIAYAPRLQRTVGATEAMYLMMRYAFDDLGYRRYEWKCDALNQASMRAAERLGFVYEGLFRQAVIYKKRNRDTAWFAVIDKDWPDVKRVFEAWLDESNFDETGIQRRSLSDIRAEKSE